MKIDCLVAEIGSTTTSINAFDKLNSNKPLFLGQGYANTTVEDITIGLENALIDLQTKLCLTLLETKEFFASSSSAGGLKMSVHGLVYDMTVKAAKEAALGAGANIIQITSGILTKYDLNNLIRLKPNIIMISGGVDYGEAQTAINNADQIARLKLNVPVIYAGNIVNHEHLKTIFLEANQEEYLYITKNVYPKIDVLDVNEARKIIHEVFEKHITKASGMEKVRQIVTNTIIPTPGAVMEATILAKEYLGNVLTIDIGGATTDIHSVVSDLADSKKIIINPEPLMKRTVEGDLGVYVNKDNLIKMIGLDKLSKDLNISLDELLKIINNYQQIPTNKQIQLVERLSLEALNVAITRHAGRFATIYGANGQKKIAEGKDLTEIEYLIATGGVLTKLPNKIKLIQTMLDNQDSLSLKPKPSTKILIDNYYIMASLGVLAKTYPNAAMQLLKQSLNIGE